MGVFLSRSLGLLIPIQSDGDQALGTQQLHCTYFMNHGHEDESGLAECTKRACDQPHGELIAHAYNFNHLEFFALHPLDSIT